MRLIRIAAGVMLLLCLTSGSISMQAQASGFENTGLGTTARGMGGAFRAVANDWTAAYYNPAGYAFIMDNQFGTNVAFFHNRHQIIPDYAARDDFGNAYGWGIVNGQEVYNFHRIFNNPAGGVVARMPVWGETVFGFSIYQPFDYNIAWRLYDPSASTFRAYNPDAADLMPSDHYRNDLDVVAFQLTASREFIEDQLSIGLGLQLLRADLWFVDLTLRDNPRSSPVSDRPRDRVPEFSNNRGNGYGLGLRGGLLWKLNDRLNLALGAALPFEITIDGESYHDFILPKYPDLLIDETNLSAEDLLFVKGEALELTSDFETKLKLPPSMSIGLAYQVTDKLLVALDAEYTMWSTFEGFEFAYSNFDGLPEVADSLAQGGFRTLESEFFTSNLSNSIEWDDAGKVMFGMMYDYSQAITLMAGASADQSPVRSGQIIPQFMDTGDKYGINGGVTFHFDRWDLGFVQSYISYDDLSTSGFSDLNGDDKFDNFPGQYEASYYETILSIVYRF